MEPVDPFAIPQKKSGFLSFLDYLDEFAQVPKNILRGDIGAAGRHVANIAGNTIDAFLPGDDIPDIARPEDYVSSADLVGVDEKEHPIVGGAVNFVGDTLLNPLTYVPGGLIAKGAAKIGGVAAAGLKTLPVGEKILEGAEKAGRWGRRVIGAQRLTGETRSTIDAANAAKSNVTRAGLAETKRILGGLSDNERAIVGDVIDNYRWEDGKLAGQLTDKPGIITPGTPRPVDTSLAVDRVALHPEVTPENSDRVRNAVQELVGAGDEMGFSHRQLKEGLDRGIFENRAPSMGKGPPGLTEAVPSEFPMRQLPNGEFVDAGDGMAAFRPEYLQRSISGMTEDEKLGQALGKPSAVKGLKLDTVEKTQDFLKANPKAVYERDALKRMAVRSEQQGALAGKAEIGRRIFGKDFAYADDEMKATVSQNIKNMAAASPEDAQVLLDHFDGMKPRGSIMSTLAGMNGIFKKFAVYGAFIPKFGATVRNKMTSVWQAAANPESRAVTGGQANRILSDLYGAFGDGLREGFGINLPSDALGKKLRAVDEAFTQSGGVADNAFKILSQNGHSDVADLMRSGITDGFVRAEDLLKAMSKSKWQRVSNIMNWPGVIFRGTEDRMRLGMGLDLLQNGKTAEDAARIVKDSLFDYSIASKENRNARDIIPFFQFQAKAIPQAIKFMAEKPYVATGLAAAMGGGKNEDPIYPYMEGKLNVPLGYDDKGNQQFASGFGLPFETLSQIPNPSGSIQDLGRDVKRDVIGSSNPLIKASLSAIMGEDPYFETPFGSYDKLPVFGHAGTTGRVYNEIAGTGLAQPVTQPLALLDKALNPNRSLGVKALDLLTGANVVSVDPDIAQQQQIQRFLDTNPAVDQYRSFSSRSHDPETMALIRQLQAAKKRSAAKRKAQGAKSTP